MRRGDIAPELRLVDDRGAKRTLSEFLEKGPVVLFFYPMAMTTGCTAECRHFRDLGKEFERLGVSRVGISRDAPDRQRLFAETNDFDFPLLSDPDKSAARAFGVRRSIGILPNRRWTFVIDSDGRIVEVIKSEMHMDRHADLALAALAR